MVLRGFLTVFAAFLLGFGSAGAKAVYTSQEDRLASFTAALNEAREAAGLTPLVVHDSLSLSAKLLGAAPDAPRAKLLIAALLQDEPAFMSATALWLEEKDDPSRVLKAWLGRRQDQERLMSPNYSHLGVWWQARKKGRGPWVVFLGTPEDGAVDEEF